MLTEAVFAICSSVKLTCWCFLFCEVRFVRFGCLGLSNLFSKAGAILNDSHVCLRFILGHIDPKKKLLWLRFSVSFVCFVFLIRYL